MELQIESESFDPDGHFFFWKPGTIIEPETARHGSPLDPANDLILNTHLQHPASPKKFGPRSASISRTSPPRNSLCFSTRNDRMLDIPAGEKNFVVTDEFTLPESVSLLAIYPHAHYLGRDMLAVAKLPAGETKTLIHIPRWDLNWQAVFTYATPIDLPLAPRSPCATSMTIPPTISPIRTLLRSVSWPAIAPATKWPIFGCKFCTLACNRRERPAPRSARGHRPPSRRK